tara:strand:+ start:138 stop:557 length:420 start_codon:yes stop_codon:yes gene_type:complete
MNKNFFIYFIVNILCIFLYGSYRCNNPEFKDILEKEIGILDLDGWSISHLLSFTLIGYLFPHKNYILLASIFGIIWELFEHYYGKNRPGWLGGYGDCKKLQSDKTDDGNWWYGKISDIIMNSLGLMIGFYLWKHKKKFK